MQKNGVVAIKADKTQPAPEIDKLLVELGNTGKAIPFVAIYPGDGGEPITLDGFLTQSQILEALEEAGPSKNRNRSTTAMK
jgi:thiol:disulfide interchange protein DsbD